MGASSNKGFADKSFAIKGLTADKGSPCQRGYVLIVHYFLYCFVPTNNKILQYAVYYVYIILIY